MAIKQINSGSPPILWSNVDKAFNDINDNFVELALSVGLGNVIDLAALASTIGPVDDNTHDLGRLSDRWRDLYLNQSIYLGDGRITAQGSSINLPAGATIGNSGQLLDEKYFKTISVTGQAAVEPDQITDVLNLNTGTGIGILTNNSTNTITFSNTGVTSLSSGAGISINASTGAISVTNTGVLAVSGTAGQIGVSASTGSVVLTNLGVLQLTTDPGSGIGLSASTGTINISNLAPNIAQNVFRFVVVPDQGPIEATTIADTLRINPGYGINLTTLPGNKTVVVSLNQNIDINGSIFSDDSALLVDGVNGVIPGTLTGAWNSPGNTFNIIGDGVNVSTDSTSLVINDSGLLLTSTDLSNSTSINILNTGVSLSSSGSLAVSISGEISAATGPVSWAVDGNYTVAANTLVVASSNVTIASFGIVSDFYGSLFGDDSTMLVDGVDGRIVGPVDTTTVLASSSIQSPIVEATDRILTTVIDSADSSAIAVVPSVVFNSDVTIENELFVSNIPGYIKLDLLKSVASASTDFADFQARIAAL